MCHRSVSMGVRELCGAAEHGDVSTVKREVSHGTDPDSKNEDGMTALMYAAWKDHVPVIEYLLSQGASIDRRGGVWDSTALHWAAGGGEVRGQ